MTVDGDNGKTRVSLTPRLYDFRGKVEIHVQIL